MPSKKKKKQPSLKSASGAGFTFEDKVAAVFLCEMLTGVHSLGTALGIIQKLERQAGDWEPFGDLLLEVPNSDGELVRCGCSVKSNRQISANGCNEELCAGLWETMAKETVFAADSDFLVIMCASLSAGVADHLNSLCLQARAIDATRLDRKIVHANVRKIYDSFRDRKNAGADGLPGRS